MHAGRTARLGGPCADGASTVLCDITDINCLVPQAFMQKGHPDLVARVLMVLEQCFVTSQILIVWSLKHSCRKDSQTWWPVSTVLCHITNIKSGPSKYAHREDGQALWPVFLTVLQQGFVTSQILIVWSLKHALRKDGHALWPVVGWCFNRALSHRRY